MTLEIKSNPWNVPLEDFLYFCCPECDERNQSKELFVKHALEHHPDAEQSLKSYGLQPVKEEECEPGEVEKESKSVLQVVKKEENIEHLESSYEYDDEDFEGDDYYDNNLEDIFEDVEHSDKNKKIHYVNNHQTSLYTKHSKDLSTSSKPPSGIVYECKKCHLDFYDVESLKNHVPCSEESPEVTEDQLQTAESTKKIYHCKFCQKEFQSQSGMLTHVKNNHDMSRPYGCSECSQRFPTERSHKQHMQLAHDISLRKNSFFCEMCGTTFTRKTSLNLHIRTLHKQGLSEPEYKCKFCNKEFRYRSNMLAHIKGMHEKSQIFTCHHCGNTFNYASGLKNHIKAVHDKVRSDPCSYCNKDFSCKQMLKNHIQIVHLGSRSDRCKFCNKDFTQRCHLIRHMKQVHKNVVQPSDFASV